MASRYGNGRAFTVMEESVTTPKKTETSAYNSHSTDHSDIVDHILDRPDIADVTRCDSRFMTNRQITR